MDDKITIKKLVLNRPLVSSFIAFLIFLSIIAVIGIMLRGYTTYLRHLDIQKYGWPPHLTNIRAINESTNSNDDKVK